MEPEDVMKMAAAGGAGEYQGRRQTARGGIIWNQSRRQSDQQRPNLEHSQIYLDLLSVLPTAVGAFLGDTVSDELFCTSHLAPSVQQRLRAFLL